MARPEKRNPAARIGREMLFMEITWYESEESD